MLMYSTVHVMCTIEFRRFGSSQKNGGGVNEEELNDHASSEMRLN